MNGYEQGKRVEGVLILLAVKEINGQSYISRGLYSEPLRKFVEKRREKALQHLANPNLCCHPKIKLAIENSYAGVEHHYSKMKIRRISRKKVK